MSPKAYIYNPRWPYRLARTLGRVLHISWLRRVGVRTVTMQVDGEYVTLDDAPEKGALVVMVYDCQEDS